MNPYVYNNFKKDMREAVEEFISSTNYFIEELDESSITLSNGNKRIRFYLEAMNLDSSIMDINGTNEKALFELFEIGNVNDKYPLNTQLKLPYEEWNKYKVRKILKGLSIDLKNYID